MQPDPETGANLPEGASSRASPELSRWSGKVALVTGASSGIGRAISSRLVAVGLTVIACARRAERLEALAELLGSVLVPAPLDMRDTGAIERVFADVAERFGGVDVLVNSAGLGHLSPLMSGSTDAWREMLEVNVLGLCVCTREAVQQMKARRTEGHIIHISSMAAHRVPQDSGVYSATKFAVRSLTEGLRLELWADGAPIRVTSISPAFVETEFAAKYHGREEAAVDAYGQYRVLQSDDVANALLYALGQPLEVQVHDLLLRPRRQAS